MNGASRARASSGNWSRFGTIRRVGIVGIALATALAAGAGTAYANMSGLTLNAPSVTTVNSTATYGSSVVLAAAPLLGSADQLNSLVFTLPENTDLSGLTTSSFALSKGTVSSINVVDAGTTRVLTVNLTGATGAAFLGGNTTITLSFPAPNPSVAGSYGTSNSFQVVANGTGGPLTATRTYSLTSWATAPAVGTPTLTDATEWATSTMNVPVTVGPAGRLDANAAPTNVTTPNRITVTFPAGYAVPATPAASSITIQGTALSTAPTVVGRAVTMNVPAGVTIANGGTATVSFLPAFGMPNPDAGTYSVSATTDIQTGSGTSSLYTVNAAPTTLTITSASQPAADIVTSGQTRAVGGFSMQRNASSSAVTVSSVSIEDVGTSPVSTVSGVDVYRDNGDGSYGPGDTKLNGAAGLFAGSTAFVTFSAAENVTTSAQQYWITYTISGTAVDAATATARIASAVHTAGSLSNGSAAGSAFTVDAAPPVVSVTVPALDGAVIGGVLPPFGIEGVATDAVSGVSSVSLEIQRGSDSAYWNGLTWQGTQRAVNPTTSDGWLNWAYSWSFLPAVQDGSESYTIRAFATDGVGFSAQASRTGVSFDNLPPTTGASVAPAAPDGHNGWYASVPSVTLTRDEAGTTYYKWDGVPSVGDQTTYAGALTPAQGTHALAFYSVDSLGNTESVGPGTTYKVDSIAPSVPAVSATAPTSTSIEVSWSASADAASGIASYTVFEGAVAVATTSGFSATLPVGAGTSHTYTVKASDVAGNVSVASNAVTVATAGTAPTTTIGVVPASADGSAGWYLSAPSVTLTADMPGTTRYRWDGAGGWSVYGGALSPAEGTHVLECFSVSSDGATESVKSRTFKVDLTAPNAPAGVQSTGPTPTSVTVAWSASTDSASGVTSYDVIDTDSDTVVRTVSGTSATVTGLAPVTTYHFAVVSHDAAGRTSARSSTVSATTQDAIVVNPGDNVTGSGGGVRVIFERILTGGTLTINPLANDPHSPPAGFRLLSTCNYDISTTSTHQGIVTVVIPYNPALVADESQLRLFHWEGNSWVDVTDTVDVVSNEIIGHTNGSLSPFGVGGPSAPAGATTPASSTWSLGLLLVGGVVIAGAETTRRRRACKPVAK